MPTVDISAAAHGPIDDSGKRRWEEMLGSLSASTAAAGWRLRTYDDAPTRFFAVAERC